MISKNTSKPHSYTLETELWLPRAIDDVFAFFAQVDNLEAITPPWLNFAVLGTDTSEIQQGTRIDYRLRLHGVPIRWQSEIAAWEPPHRFVDRQLRGPYRLWHHEHRFLEENGGTRVIDRVDYIVPGGRLVHWLFVKRDLETIFRFRHDRLLEVFSTGSGA